MKKLVVIAVCLFSCAGCGSILNRIPENSFTEMKWERSAWGTYGEVSANGGAVKDGILSVDYVHIKESNPAFNLEFTITGYQREVK